MEGASLLATDGLRKEDVKCCGRLSVGLWNVLWMGICCFGLFSCFNPIQSLQSSTAPAGYGFIGIGVLYGAFSVATLVSSQIVRVLGQKLGLFLGALCYAVYVVTLLILRLTEFQPGLGYEVVYYLASAVIGIGAALLWTSQGSIVTIMATPATLGFYNGVFWAAFMSNYLAGGLITEFVLGTATNASEIRLYIIFSTLAVSSVLGMLLIRSTPSIARQPMSGFKVFETVKMLGDRRYRYLWPAIIYSGFSSAFFNVIYTGYIGSAWVGLVLVVFGACEVIGSLVGGRVSDLVGRTPVFLVSCLCTLVGISLAAMSVPNLAGGTGVVYYFLAYAFMGFGDSGFNTQVQGVIGKFYPEESQPAFAAYRFLLSISAMIGSISGFYLSNRTILIPVGVLWGNLILALTGWLILDFRIASVSDAKKDQREMIQ